MTAIDASVSELSSSLVSRRPLSADFTLFASTSSSGDATSVRSTSGAEELLSCTPTALLRSTSSPTSPSSHHAGPYDALESTGATSTLHELLAGVGPSVGRGQQHQQPQQQQQQQLGRHQFGSLHTSGSAQQPHVSGGVSNSSQADNSVTATNSNWLADLSVEVCKVDDDEEEEEEEEEEEGAEEESGGHEADDWDESVFFEAVTAGHSSTTQHHHRQDGAGHLDVLLGNPNFHNTSGTDLLELDQSCCNVDFPSTSHHHSDHLTNVTVSGVGTAVTPGRISSTGSQSCSSSEEDHQHRHPSKDHQVLSATAAGPTAGVLLSSPPSTPSPSGSVISSGSGGRCPQQQPLPQPPQPCSMCSKVFTSTSALAKHKLTHSDERRFSCQLCGKAFKRQDHLNGHLITHREKKPFECRADGCGKSYCDARSLRRHQDNHHASTSGNVAGSSTTQQSSPAGSHHPPRSSSSSSSSSSSAGLFISELSTGGSADLLCTANNGNPSSASYPAPNSNSSSSSGGHFSGGNWAAVAPGTTEATESCLQYTSSHGSQQTETSDGLRSVKTDMTKQTNAHKNTTTTTAAIKKAKAKTNKVISKATGNGKKKAAAPTDGQQQQANNLTGTGNDGLTTQQLELIQEIMRQTQEQHRLMQEEHHKTVPPAPVPTPSPAPANKMKKPKVKWTPPSQPSAAESTAARPSPPTDQNGPSNSNSPASAAVAATTAGRPVECNVCQRRFKNTPALNGHMRLHGGFLKKDADCGSNGTGSGGSGGNSGSNGANGSGSSGSGGSKKPGDNSKRDPNTPPLLTASVSIRALIEEKIIQRRNNLAAISSSTTGQEQRSATNSEASTTTASTISPMSAVQVTSPSLSRASVPMAVDVMEDMEQETQQQTQSAGQTLVPKLEPEAYFEGSLLALSPVSLHRALEGDMDVNDDDPGSSEGGGQQSLHHHLHHAENFFSTSSSSSSALSDVPLLDDSVFHQVSAAAASALLSDISSLDLQSYIDSSGADQNGLAHEQADDGQTDEGPYSDCLSQYLAGSSDDGGRQHNHHDASNPDTANVYHETNFQTHHGVHPSDGYVSYQHETTNGGGGFAFDPSTPLSSLCSPPHYVQQPQHQYHQNHLPVQPDYQHNGTADATSTVTSNGFHQQTMMIPATVPSPYTPSPSPVSPIVPSHLQQQQQQQRFQHQNGFYSGVTHPTYPTAMHTQQQQQPQQTSTSFMIDCANSVLYNMADSAGSGWDHAAELTSVTTEALPHLMEQHQHEPIMDDPIIGKPVKVKKPRPSRAKKSISLLEEPPPEVKKRRKPASSGNKGANELDEMLMAARSSAAGRFTSSMRPSTALLLDPKRPGTGLYWNLVKNETVTPPVLTAPSLSSRQLAKSRVRIGKDHQCTALPRCKKKEGNKDKEPAILCWSGSSSAGGEQQVARLLAWSRSSALPGPRRTEEEVLAVLTHFRNDLQATKMHLFTQSSVDSNRSGEAWSQEEMAIFHAALLQHGKNFSQVAQHLPSKTARQCVQFYYIWKKLCRPQDYVAVKAQGHCNIVQSTNHTDEQNVPDWTDVGAAELMSLTQPAQDCSSSSSSTPLLLLPSCELADCPAISNNRDMLEKLYPCSVCHKVFDKVKSRSAHMKTHKMNSNTSAVTTIRTASPVNKHHNKSIHHMNKSPAAVMAATPSPLSTTSHSSLSSTSCSLPSPFLPSQSLF